MVAAIYLPAELTTSRSDGGWTSLHNACKDGSLDLVKVLINADADVNVELLNGRTPLHIAAEFGNEDATRFLLSQPHTKRTVKDRFGSTPLLMAAQHGKKRIAEMLAPWNRVEDLSRDEIEASKQVCRLCFMTEYAHQADLNPVQCDHC